MTAIVSAFFAPANPKRPANFVVIKYFLLGLLISNSIESILIIPKILDVLDQNKMQHHRLETADIQRKEVKELAHARQEQERKMQEIALREQQEKAEKAGEKYVPKKHKETTHKPVVRRRPQREDTGTNPVAVFMLFYGAVTLCLGIVGLFKEMQLLIAMLIGICAIGVVVLISSGFSLIMLMSVSKDTIIAILSYKYRQMIVQSDALVASELAAASGVAGVPPVDYSQQQYAGQVQQ